MFLFQFCLYSAILAVLVHKKVSNSDSFVDATVSLIRTFLSNQPGVVEPERGGIPIPTLPSRDTVQDEYVYEDMKRSISNTDDILQVSSLKASFTIETKKNWYTRSETKRVDVLDDLWFSVREKECFGFLGRNGSGKTTTMKALIGLQRVDGGYARMGLYQLVPNYNPTSRALVGVCPQFDILWEKITTLEHLNLFATIKGCDVTDPEYKERLDQIMESTGLKPFANKYTVALSGGNRRKISVIAASLGSPSVIFLDGKLN
jgi:ABC-type glutathione transport system ATPase component